MCDLVGDLIGAKNAGVTPPLLFIVSRGGAQGEVKKSYSAWQLARPVVRRCPSGRIEAES
jgi:hypothetical protein